MALCAQIPSTTPLERISWNSQGNKIAVCDGRKGTIFSESESWRGASRLGLGLPDDIQGLIERMQGTGDPIDIHAPPELVKCVLFSRLRDVVAVGVGFEVLFFDTLGSKMPMSADYDRTVFDVSWAPPDDRRVAVCGQGGTVRIFDRTAEAAALPLLVEAATEDLYLSSVSFSQDGQLVASCGSQGIVYVHDMRGENVAVCSAGPIILEFPVVRFSPTDSYRIVMCAKDEPFVCMFDLSREQGTEYYRWPIARYDVCDRGVKSVCFSPDGKVLAACDAEGEVTVLDAYELSSVDIMYDSPSDSDAPSDSDEDNQMTMKRLGAIHFEHACNDVSFSPDGSRVAVCGPEGVNIFKWEHAHKEMLRVAAQHVMLRL